jgi:hypothetical protein
MKKDCQKFRDGTCDKKCRKHAECFPELVSEETA